MIQLEKKSKFDGSVVWLVGGLHGDEPGGSAVIQKLFAELERVELLKGSLHAFPLINEGGAEKKTRELPATGEDLNRLFPGQANGTDGQKIIHQVWQTITAFKPDLVLDLHNDWVKSVPYVLIDNETTAPVALASGLIVVKENPVLLETFTGALSLELNKIGIPALTLELGGAYVIDEKNVRVGVNAISRILCQLGLISAEIFPEANSRNEMVNGKIFQHSHAYSDEPKPTTTGRIKMFVEPGQMIKKGDLIAKIGDREELFSQHDGIILGYTDETMSHPGQEIVALGVAD